MGLRTVTFKASEGLESAIRSVAERLGWSKSTVIRAALAIGLSALEAWADGSGCAGTAYRCPFCGEVVCGLARFREHVLDAHILAGNGYRCPACGRTYSTRKALARHAAENAGDGLHDLVYALTAMPAKTSNRSRRLSTIISSALRMARVEPDDSG